MSADNVTARISTCCWASCCGATAADRRPSIDIFCTPGQQQQNRRRGVRRPNAGTDRSTDGRMPRPCCAYYAGSANKKLCYRKQHSFILTTLYIIHNKRFCTQGLLSQMDPRDELLDARRAAQIVRCSVWLTGQGCWSNVDRRKYCQLVRPTTVVSISHWAATFVEVS